MDNNGRSGSDGRGVRDGIEGENTGGAREVGKDDNPWFLDDSWNTGIPPRVAVKVPKGVLRRLCNLATPPCSMIGTIMRFWVNTSEAFAIMFWAAIPVRGPSRMGCGGAG